MNKEQFLQLLVREGFPDPVEVHQIPNGSLGLHTHPFEVRALIIKGSIQIPLNGQSANYHVGEMFSLDFERAHEESYGLDGVTYLASRRSV
ncbi:cupin [Polynucleobacter necessarius]|uniref:cupin n=1 Tax=Polynucleobacter necessarius TaxID=576610 RepID=UPI000E0928E2|nr:cupin [Polynucleobacter necessarius]